MQKPPKEVEIFLNWLKDEKDLKPLKPYYHALSQAMLCHEGKKVSLSSFLVKKLSQENEELQKELSHLSLVAKENHRIFEVFGVLLVSLMEVDSLQALQKTLLEQSESAFSLPLFLLSISEKPKKKFQKESITPSLLPWVDGLSSKKERLSSLKIGRYLGALDEPLLKELSKRAKFLGVGSNRLFKKMSGFLSVISLGSEQFLLVSLGREGHFHEGLDITALSSLEIGLKMSLKRVL